MRTLFKAALLVSGLIAAVPAAAQVYYNSSPGTPDAPIPPPSVYDPAGPAWHNDSGAVPPGAPTVYDPAGPTYYNDSGAVPPGYPQARVSPNPPYIPGPSGANPPYVAMPSSYMGPPAVATPPGRHNGGRWGGSVNGRWWGGAQAPGGWGGYRRPSRGHSLPGYWMSSNFHIPDYASFGLRAPGNGYFWVRYYDDAVLVDGRGRVWDSVGGIAWSGGGYGSAYASASASASASTSYGRRPIRQIDPNYGYGYGYPGGGYAPPATGAPPAVHVQSYPQGYACPQTCPGGGTYYGGGGYYGGSTTTVVIQSAPVVTTTVIEEVIEEVTTTYVSTPRRVVRRAAPKRRYKPKPAPRQCGCQCVCR